MNDLLVPLAPSATTQIRADHAHVLAAFHHFDVGLQPETKRVLVNTVCRALDIHAQLEEELFYPVMYEIDPPLIEKSVPEHHQVRARVSALSSMDPLHPEYDQTFLALMHDVMRHVADEETMLLPEAERRLLPRRLHEIGAQMVSRRAMLLLSRGSEIARDTFRSPAMSLALAGSTGWIAASYLLSDAMRANPLSRRTS